MMKKVWIWLLALLLALPAFALGEDQDVLGRWQITCYIESTYFSEEPWEQYLDFEADGTVTLLQGGSGTKGAWTKDGSCIYTDLADFDCLQLVDGGLLLCGSYQEGKLFTRDGKMPAYEQIEGGVSEDGFYYEQLGDGTLEITGHIANEDAPEFDENGVMTNALDLVLPSSIRGIPVRSVGMLAFYGNSRLRSAVLPEGIFHLGREAFNDCVNLEEVHLPNSLGSMGGYVFSRCEKLHAVHIPAGVQDIDFNPFTECTAISAFDLDEGNKWYRLENGALMENATDDLIAFPAGSAQTAFSVPDYVKRIRLGAFMGCESLQEVKLPEGLLTLESFAFESTGLTRVNVPASLVEMRDNPFNHCRDLAAVDVAEGNQVFSSVDGVLFDAEKSRLIFYPIGRPGYTYTVPEGTRVIGTDAFSRNRQLVKVLLPSSLETIEDYAFNKMNALAEMDIPEGVTRIDAYAFCQCDELRKVVIPSTVSEIKYATFAYCEDLEVVLPEGILIDEFAFEEAERITLTWR